jgi:hypothetical protein
VNGEVASESRLASLLLAALHQQITAPDADAGAARIAELAGHNGDIAGWLDTVAEAVRIGLARDPVRLPEGALQCHWHLELTKAGIAAARQLQSQGVKIQ